MEKRKTGKEWETKLKERYRGKKARKGGVKKAAGEA
jgi:hypothetical protein